MTTTPSTLLALAALLATPALARAEFKNWTGGATGIATSWSTAANWSPTGVPANGDNVSLYGLLNVNATINYDYAAALTFASLNVTHSNPDPELRERSSTLNISAFNVTSVAHSVGDTRTAGVRGWGIVNQSGATNTVLSTVMLIGVSSAQDRQDRGTYNLSNGLLNPTAGLTVGFSGDGTFNQSGGTVSLAGRTLTLAENATGFGRYTLNAGILTTNTTYVGYSGNGTFTQAGGVANLSNATLGFAAGSTGAYSLSGGTLSGNLTVGRLGTGTFNMTGGVANLGTFVVAQFAPATATLNTATLTSSTAIIAHSSPATLTMGTGSTLQAVQLSLGFNAGGNGLLTVAPGSQVIAVQGVSIAAGPSSSGTITLQGPNSTLRSVSPFPAQPAGSLSIGNNGTGVLNLFNGALCDGFVNTYVAKHLNSRGYVNVDGPDTLWRPNNLYLADDPAAGTITVTSGTVLPTLTSVASYNSAVGVISLNGTASSWITAFTDLGVAGAGTLSITGGASYRNDGGRFDLGITQPSARGTIIVDGPGSRLQSNATINLGKQMFGGPGTLIITNGGTALVRDLVDNGPVSTLTLDGGTLDLQGFQIGPTNPIDNLNLRAGTLKNVAQINNGATPLTKSGPGTLILPTPNTHTGGTRVQQGTLLIQHPAALNSGALTLDPASRAALQFGPAATRLASLAIAGSPDNWSAQLDLTSAALVLPASPALIATLLNQINSGKTSGIGGPWTGNGITSSTIPAAPNTSLALVLNADLHLASFRGLPVTDADLILVQALLGDATLDNKVDAFDLNRLAANWQQSNKHWSSGDFTGDGIVNAFDLNLLAAHWQSGAASLLSEISNTQISNPLLPPSLPIPEPASLLLLAPALALLRPRRNPR